MWCRHSKSSLKGTLEDTYFIPFSSVAASDVPVTLNVFEVGSDSIDYSAVFARCYFDRAAAVPEIYVHLPTTGNFGKLYSCVFKCVAYITRNTAISSRI